MGVYSALSRSIPWRAPASVSDSVAVVGEAVEDLVGGLVPDLGLGLIVPAGDPSADRGDEVFDGVVCAAFDPLGGELREPALDEVLRLG